MGTRKTSDIYLFFLAVIFSIALMFAFIELPRLIDLLVQKYFGFPGFDQGADNFNTYKTELFIDALYLRWIGYICFSLVIIFIIIGFSTRKTGWVWAGAFTLFLPVFGQFALSMFFLAGLGVLRVIWLPFMDISINVLDLGNIIYLPYWFLLWFFGLFDWYAHTFIAYLFMLSGSFVFVWGVLSWFKIRHSGDWVVNTGIYKFSRHPQYLGWIIWSYGLLLFASQINQMKKTWSIPDSLPWLLIAMIIIALCFLEEIKMAKFNREKYNAYQKQTSFLFPLPKWLAAIIGFPIKLITGKDRPQTIKEVLSVTCLYTLILILISAIWVDFEVSGSARDFQIIRNSEISIDSLVAKIREPQSRRQLYTHFVALKELGDLAIDPAISILSDKNPATREFAADLLGSLKAKTAIDTLVVLLQDPDGRVRNSAIYALGDIGTVEVLEPLQNILDSGISGNARWGIYRAFGRIGSEKTWPILVQALGDSLWYNQTAALTALNQINRDKSWPYVFYALQDSKYQVRRNAVMLILTHKPHQAVKPLESVLNDPDFETRFYARQALKLIDE